MFTVGYSFALKHVAVGGTASVVDMSSRDHLIVVGFHNSDHLLHLYNTATLAQVQSIASDYSQCLSVKFLPEHQKIVFLAENRAGGIDVCMTDRELSKIEVITSYPIGETFRDLVIDHDRGVLFVVGHDIDIWDIKTWTKHKRMVFNDGTPKQAVLVASKNELLVSGAEQSTLLVFTGEGDFDIPSKIEIPFDDCKQLLVALDNKRVLVSQPGMAGAALYDTDRYTRILQDTFNEATLKTHYLFIDTSEHVFRIGKARCSLLNVKTNEIARGPKYDAGRMYDSCSAAFDDYRSFCFIDEHQKLFKVDVFES